MSAIEQARDRLATQARHIGGQDGHRSQGAGSASLRASGEMVRPWPDYSFEQGQAAFFQTQILGPILLLIGLRQFLVFGCAKHAEPRSRNVFAAGELGSERARKQHDSFALQR
jgi:hypothetical protein